MQFWGRLFGKGAAENRTVRTDAEGTAALTAVSPGMPLPPVRGIVTPLPAVSGRKPGELLGGVYPVVRKLGEGGFGEVFLCRHPAWNIDVAVKVPSDRTLAEAGTLSELQREAEEWTGLGLHPYIAYCYCLHPIGDLPLFVVEFAARGTLRDRIERDKDVLRDLRGNLDLAIQLCHALEHAHGRGLIHRDLKPENILIAQDSTPKLTDFGIAKRGAVGAAAGQVLVPNQTLAWGTPGYTAPEQTVAGAPIDGRADLFGLGVCLYELFCFNRPYDTTLGPPQEPRRPSNLRRDVALPQGLQPLLLRLVAWQPAGRPVSAQAVRAELAAIYRASYDEASRYEKLPELQLTASGHNNRGVSYHFLGKHAAAEAAFQEALAGDPLHPEATYNLGLMRWQRAEMTDFDLANQLEHIRIVEPSWRASYLLGLVHLERRDRNSAIKLLESAHAADPQNTEALDALTQARAVPDTETIWHLKTFEGHSKEVTSVALSPDGSRILSGSYDNTLRLWDVSSGQCECLHIFEGHSHWYTSVAFSLDGRLALSGSSGSGLRLWDVATGRLLHTFDSDSSGAKSIAFSPDGQSAISGGSDVRLWDISTGTCVRIFKGHTSSIESVAFSSDSKLALSGSYDQTLRLWEVETGRCVNTFDGNFDATFSGHTQGITSVTFSPDDRLILSGSSDRTMRLWDAATGQCIRTFYGHNDAVLSVAFCDDDQFALSGGRDNSVRLWQVATGRCLQTLRMNIGQLSSSIAFANKCRLAVVSDSDCALNLWAATKEPAWSNKSSLRLAQLESLPEIIGGANRRNALLSQIDSAVASGQVKEALELFVELESIPGLRRDRQITERRRRLASLCRRGSLRSAWRTRLLTGHTDLVSSAAFSPDGEFAASASHDTTLRLWELATGRCVHTFEWHAEQVNSVAFSPNGRLLLSGSSDKTVRLWESVTGRCLRTINEHTDAVHAVAFSPDGKSALSGSGSRWSGLGGQPKFCLWDLMTGSIQIFDGEPITGVKAVAFSPDGRLVLSGDEDGTVRIWEVASMRCLQRLQGHTGAALAVAFSIDGKYIVSLGADKALRVWDAATRGCLWIAEERAYLTVALSHDAEIISAGTDDGRFVLWRTCDNEHLRDLHCGGGAVQSVVLSPDSTHALVAQGNNIEVWYLDWELLVP